MIYGEIVFLRGESMPLIDFLQKAFQIMLVDLVMSGDNIGIIALAVNKLPKKSAAQAKLIGIGGALTLRVVFVFCISLLLSMKWLHIGLFGGVVLLIVTWNMIKDCAPDEKKQGHPRGGKEMRRENRFFRAVFAIIIADASMSFDNVLAIASIVIRDSANAKIGMRELALIIFGLAFCIPIIFFGSSLVGGLLKRYPIVIFICAGVLVNAALKMMFDDSFLSGFFAGTGHIAAFILGILTAVYGAVGILLKPRKS